MTSYLCYMDAEHAGANPHIRFCNTDGTVTGDIYIEKGYTSGTTLKNQNEGADVYIKKSPFRFHLG